MASLNTVGNADVSDRAGVGSGAGLGPVLVFPLSRYRIARVAGPTQERRAQATHSAKVKPELRADAPLAGVELGQPLDFIEGWRP